MRSSSLANALRLAAFHALAVPATAGLAVAACGGSVQQDLLGSGAADSGSGPDDAGGGATDGAPADVTVIDSALPEDAGPRPDAPFDAQAPDGACVLPAPIPTCGTAVSSCLPTGLVVGENATCPPCSGPGGFGAGCNVTVTSTGDYSILCQCAVGRFPAGLALAVPPASAGDEDPVGAFLARGAALEASAVRAFEQLAREVAAHGAPAALVRRLRRAARQEIRHARLLGREAKVRGAKIPKIHARRAPVHARSLFALALENAVEGCGREAVGGALLHLQAMTAEDAALRVVLAELAQDECGHAELSQDLADWLASRLGDEERARLDAARRAFFEACAGAPPRGDLAARRALGLPAPAVWRRLVGAVEESMRAAA